MHDQWKRDFEEALPSLPEADKAELVARILRTMQPRNGHGLRTPAGVSARIAELAALPDETPRDGFAGRDHDTILYGSPPDITTSS